MLRSVRPDLLALSASLSMHLGALRDAVARVRAVMGPAFPIAVGGLAVTCSDDVAALDVGPGVIVTCNDPEELVERARELLGVGAAATADA
jgi:hypothetical protein